MHEVNVPKSSLRGASFAPKRAGSLHPDGGPTGVFRYRGDEFIAIMVMPYQWSQMIKAMNMPELADDPRFDTPRGRRDNNAALKHIIEGWLGDFPSRDAAVAALEAERVPCAPVLSLHEAMAHPHLRARGTVRRVRDEAIGAFDIPGLPVKFSRWAEGSEIAADRLGEHNEAVLRELLALTDPAFTRTRSWSAIRCSTHPEVGREPDLGYEKILRPEWQPKTYAERPSRISRNFAASSYAS
jgi:CoA:oxalate CoA-transferase